jgi:hypothetical protein
MRSFFDPTDGTVIRQPPGEGGGYWAGAPTVWYDASSSMFYLAYRLRRPRGVEPDRGGETRIARSTDGITFDDIWRAEKAQFDSPSIERCALVRARDGRWHHFVSYVDGADGRWRTDRIEAASPETLDPAAREPVFTAGDLGSEGVKDPKIVRFGDVYWMLLSTIPTPDDGSTADAMHGTADIYNTGLSISCSALASSLDLVNWQWHGEVMRPNPASNAWDRYARRIGTVWAEGAMFVGFYDGSANVDENYEERTGVVVSGDLFDFRSLTPDAPTLVSPHTTGSLRYIDVVDVDDKRWYYYEMTRADGGHELRVSMTQCG